MMSGATTSRRAAIQGVAAAGLAAAPILRPDAADARVAPGGKIFAPVLEILDHAG